MVDPQIHDGTNTLQIGADFFHHLCNQGWTYVRTVVDVVREPVLILDKDFRIRAANVPFYRTFQVDAKDTENKIVYELGNGQWNIPALRKLLEDILPKNAFFEGFEVSHEFPAIGKKNMILNARQIHFTKTTESALFPPIIMLAIEDVTEMMSIAEKLARHTNEFEDKIVQRTTLLEAHIARLELEIRQLKNKP
ncbi:MAG: hypothetical protein AAB343_03090 [Patescibacteria group bacterium]